MAPKLALLLYSAFIIWQFRYARRRGWSKELWIPLIWVLIIGSKPIGLWLALLTGTGRDAEGSSLDTAIFLGLLLVGFRVLSRRMISWSLVITNNKWLFCYFAYVGFSILWSDRPFGSFKLWVKDAGNILMVLVILSQKPFGEGARTVLIRAAYVLIPLSILLTKYFPDLGRGYDPWTWQPLILGAAESKNALGATIILCSFGLLWNMFDPETNSLSSGLRILAHLVMTIATVWILLQSSCATALACIIVGIAVFLALRNRVMLEQTRRLGGTVFVVVILLALLLHFMFGAGQMFVGALGRDETLTGRTPIWEAVLNTHVNPIFGVGYSSFWYGEQARVVSEHLGFYFTLKEAHNGFIELYLNCGFLGLFFLMASVMTASVRVIRRLRNASYEVVRLIFIVVALIYNVTESAFAGLNAIWFLLMLALVEYPRQSTQAIRPSLFFNAVDQDGHKLSESTAAHAHL